MKEKKELGQALFCLRISRRKFSIGKSCTIDLNRGGVSIPDNIIFREMERFVAAIIIKREMYYEMVKIRDAKIIVRYIYIYIKVG